MKYLLMFCKCRSFFNHMDYGSVFENFFRSLLKWSRWFEHDVQMSNSLYRIIARFKISWKKANRIASWKILFQVAKKLKKNELFTKLRSSMKKMMRKKIMCEIYHLYCPAIIALSTN